MNEIDKQLQKEFGSLEDPAKAADDNLSAMLSKLGSADKDQEDEVKSVAGLTDDGTLVLPDEPPKQKPLAKVSIARNYFKKIHHLRISRLLLLQFCFFLNFYFLIFKTKIFVKCWVQKKKIQKKKSKGSKRATSAMVKGHHRKTKKWDYTKHLYIYVQ